MAVGLRGLHCGFDLTSNGIGFVRYYKFSALHNLHEQSCGRADFHISSLICDVGIDSCGRHLVQRSAVLVD